MRKLKSENEKMRIARCVLAILFALVLSLNLSSCADEDGLHDQNALMVKFDIKGLGEVSGDYYVTGGFDSWGKNSPVTLSNGYGTVEGIPVTETSTKFSICDKNWNRAWYPEFEGNLADENSDGKYWNFYIGSDKEPLKLSAGNATIEINPEYRDDEGRIVPQVSYK